MMNAISSFWMQLLFVVFLSVQSIQAMDNSPGETHPLRVEMKINSNANITCRINPTKFPNYTDSSSLYFVEEDTGKRVPSLHTEILNETAIVFHLRNAKEQQRNYICKSDDMAIGITHVIVGTAPQNVTDFKCRGHDYTYMVCNFTMPHNLIPTKYNLYYMPQTEFRTKTLDEKEKRFYSQDNKYVCTLEVQDKQAICNLTQEQNSYRYSQEYFNFTLEVNNELGGNVQNFWINNYESVIPPKPVYGFEKITNNSAVIKWRMPKYSYYAAKGLQYQVLLRLKNRANWMNFTKFKTRNNGSEYRITLFDLPYAYFWYELSLRVRVTSPNDDSYWSEPHIEEFQTKACPPNAAPLTDVGSFYINSTETVLRLYWHQIPDYRVNGPDFKYTIKQIKMDDVEVSMEPLHIDRISAVFRWNKTHNYEFVIVSSNAEGESPDHSTITVPRWPKHDRSLYSPEWIRNVYNRENRTYTLSWNAPKKTDDLINYTVFWCQSKKATPDECEDSINFKHVNKNTTMFETSSEDKSLNMAVSANYRLFNSGMHWSPCAADGTSDLAKMEPEKYASARSITLQWDSEHVCQSLVEGYNITYCRLHRKHNTDGEKSTVCAEEPITRTLPGRDKKFVIENLHPFSTYKVEMLMFSKYKHGKMSEPQIVSTTEEAPSQPSQLEAHNITSNSAVLTWLSPEHHNGVLKKYRIEYNNEHHIIECSSDETGSLCSQKKMTYTLENLSSFTSYKVYVVAHTIADSKHSNDITVNTLVGIPSNPRHVKTKEKTQNVLQWSPPEVPSGRVEFYEVAIEVLYKDVVQRQHISTVVGSTECVYHLPVCVDADYRFKLHVRAVNVARRDTEIDRYIFATMNKTFVEREHRENNDDLRCEGDRVAMERQRALIEEYSDSQKYVQYKSVWSVGPVTNCSYTKSSRILMLSLLVLVLSAGLAVGFNEARKVLQKMANITCVLPPDANTVNYPNYPKNDYNNENRYLLSSISNDSGYICHNGDDYNRDHINAKSGGGGGDHATDSLGKSCDYMGSDHSTQYCSNEAVIRQGSVDSDRTPDGNDAYMAMELLNSNEKICQREPTGYTQPTFSAINGGQNTQLPSWLMPTQNGYITQVTATKINNASQQMIPTENGYVKPDEKLLQQEPHSNSFDSMLTTAQPENRGGYIQPTFSAISGDPKKQLSPWFMPTATNNAAQQMRPSENAYVKPQNFINWPTQKFSAKAISPLTARHKAVPTTLGDMPMNNSGYVSPEMLQKSLLQPPSTNGYTTLEALANFPQIFTTATKKPC
ncbi:cytokine receptor isoform X1 [Stomoxys calcitrans]|uniref:cytokine receptor isoform X1 n=1 Tax=Stomoxys calcitrans TaxID=35570 RepID=UPI0027E2B4EA|nr:cytokine receptor isoform X1 [Stomoxys calcitrans]